MFWLVVASFAPTAAHAAESVLVRRALDGDSLLLADGRQVRLIGINTPEHGEDGTAEQPLARDARALMTSLVANRRVALHFDPERLDRYGRTLAYAVLADGRDAQELMLKQGLAWAVAIPPNLSRLTAYQAAEREARNLRRGVWSLPAYAPVPAEGMTVKDTGFRLVRGRIGRLAQSKALLIFEFSSRMSLVVPRADWQYFAGAPASFAGREVIARGWVTAYNGKLRMRVRHAAMLEAVH